MSCSHSKAQFINVNITPNGHWRTNLFFFPLLSKLCSPWSYQKWVTWVTEGKNEVENALKVFHYEVLENKGKISHEQAKNKAFSEYEKYKVIQDNKYVSDFDRLLIETKKIEDN